jgi:hypothetical protein
LRKPLFEDAAEDYARDPDEFKNKTTKFLNEQVFELCCHGRFKDLPAPLCLKTEPEVPYTMQLFLQPCRDEPTLLDTLKHINLHQHRMDVSALQSHCQGTPMLLDYGKKFNQGAMAWQYMMEQLLGFQIRFWCLSPQFDKAASCNNASTREDGYTSIREKGPKANNTNQFQEWADKQCNEIVNSPIYGWQEARVKEALGNHAKGRANARTLDFWPLTLKDFAGCHQGILKGPHPHTE